jgi:3-hydroxyisobutyrate dehydrogenase-like beta-hydroxyacid dehydrogenase
LTAFIVWRGPSASTSRRTERTGKFKEGTKVAKAKSHETVSVVGAGAMGAALAKAFLAKKCRVTVWNRSAEKCRPLQAAGATLAPSLAAAVAASRVTVVCVSNYDVSNAMLRKKDVASQLGGKVLVQLTTGTPREAREGEAWSKKTGMKYLDGAIMAYPSQVGSKDCTILYSGPQNVFEANRKLLLSLGGAPTFVGDNVGNASILDQSLLSFVVGSILSFLHGAAICASEGFPISGYVSAAAPVLSLVEVTMKTSETMIQRKSYEGSEASLNAWTAALEHIVRTSRENGVDRALPEFLLSYFKKALAAGRGSEEIAALFEFLKSKRGSRGRSKKK